MAFPSVRPWRFLPLRFLEYAESIAQLNDIREWHDRFLDAQIAWISALEGLLDQRVPDWRSRVTRPFIPPPPG
jgi:hypothetical protein